MSCKINRKYCQEIYKVRNDDIYLNSCFALVKNLPFAAVPGLQKSSGNMYPTLLEAPPTCWIGWMGTSMVPYGQPAPTTAQWSLDLVTALATPLLMESQLLLLL